MNLFYKKIKGEKNMKKSYEQPKFISFSILETDVLSGLSQQTPWSFGNDSGLDDPYSL